MIGFLNNITDCVFGMAKTVTEPVCGGIENIGFGIASKIEDITLCLNSDDDDDDDE